MFYIFRKGVHIQIFEVLWDRLPKINTTKNDPGSTSVSIVLQQPCGMRVPNIGLVGC